MDWLTRPFPESITVAGQVVPIRTGWRRCIRSYILQDELRHKGFGVTDANAVLTSWFSRDGCIPEAVIQNPHEALKQAFLWRDQAFSEALPYGDDIPQAPAKERLFDWQADSGIVCIDFLTHYGIDLQDWQAHWYKFALLFSGLCASESLVSTAINARKPLSRDADKYTKTQHRAQKKAWALPISEYERIQRHNAQIREQW